MIKIIDLRAKFSEEEIFKKFNAEAYAIPNLYLSLLQPFDSGTIKYCIIYVSPDCNFNKIGKTKFYADFYSLFDFNEYFSKNEVERKRMQLLVVHKAMLEIADEHGWERKLFEGAYQKCLSSDLVFREKIKKIKVGPNKKRLSLSAFCDLHILKVEWSVSNKNGDTIEQGVVIEDVPSSLDIIYQLDFEWVSDDKFIVKRNYKGLITNIWEIFLSSPTGKYSGVPQN